MQSESQQSYADPAAVTPPGADRFPVIGIVATPGCLTAVQVFLAHLPPDSGAAVLIFGDAGSAPDGSLADLLQSCTTIPLIVVHAPFQPAANRIYLLPPDRSLTLQGSMLHPTPADASQLPTNLGDSCLRALAHAYAEYAVAVLPAGTGSDGLRGLQDVATGGGLTIVQHPGDAEPAELPRAVLAAPGGRFHLMLRADLIPAAIMHFRRLVQYISSATHGVLPVSPDAVLLREILALLQLRTDHDIRAYKQALLLHRIARRMYIHSLATLHDYLSFFQAHPEEAAALQDDLLQPVTRFFRDPEAWQGLKDVLPQVLAGKQSDEQVRVWVAGCATGEEVYSLVMLLFDQLALLPAPPEILIFATDTDPDVIAEARRGLYGRSIAEDLSAHYLERFFRREQGHYRVADELRGMILFAHHDILDDPPFSRLDLIVCRNLLLAFGEDARHQLLKQFHFALRPAGYLMLGASEVIEPQHPFAQVNMAGRLYQRQNLVSAAPGEPVQAGSPLLRGHPVAPPEPEFRVGQSIQALSRDLLAQYGPVSILVNETFDILHLGPNAGRFLRFNPGTPSYNLPALAPLSMRQDLRMVLQDAVRSGQRSEARGVQVTVDGRIHRLTIVVQPVPEPASPPGMLLVLLYDLEAIGDQPLSNEQHAAPLINRLEAELQESRARLQLISEQYETALEELTSSNEELEVLTEDLQALNEELATSKEEQQALNEELLMVNQELKYSFADVSQHNDDLQNLMAATAIATLFVDPRQRLMRYTPAALAIFNLIPADLGRPLPNITHNLEQIDLSEGMDRVLQFLTPIEYEVRSRADRWYIARLQPYHSGDGQIGGVVLTFVEITQRKQAEAELRISENRFRAIADLVPDMLWSNDAHGAIQWYNQRWLEYTGQTLEQALAYGLQALIHPDDRGLAGQHFPQAIASGTPLRQEYRIRAADGIYRWFLVQAEPVRDEFGTIVQWFGAATDIQEQRTFLETLQASEERLRLVLEHVQGYAIITLDPDGTMTGWNSGARQTFGYDGDEIVGRSVAILFTPEDQADDLPARDQQTAIAEGLATDDRWYIRKDGSRFYGSGVLSPVYDGAGRLCWFVQVLRDLTDQKQAEEQLHAAYDILESRVQERTRELATSNRERQELLQRLLSAQEEERLRIARDLHDQLGQQIISLQLGLKQLEDHAGDGALIDLIKPIQAVALQMARETHRLAMNLRPTALDDIGLVPALERLVADWSAQTQIAAALDCRGMDQKRLEAALETGVYRVVQEALNNVRKHAEATTVSVLLERRAQQVTLIVEDDGCGFDPDMPAHDPNRPPLGILGMRERVDRLGGTLNIESSQGNGTTLFVRIPLSEQPATDGV